MIPYIKKTENKIYDMNEKFYDDGQFKDIKWCNEILLNRPLKVFITLFAFGILTPILLYNHTFLLKKDLPPPDGFSMGSCVIPRNMRLLCGLGNITEDECHFECCYDLSNNMCFHRMPSRFTYIVNTKWTENVTMTPRINTIPFKFQKSIRNLKLSVDEVSKTYLSLTFYDAENKSLIGNKIDIKNYSYEISSPEFDIVVKSSQGVIFSSKKGTLIASNNIWELTFKLTNESMYGLGEIPLQNTAKVIYSHKQDVDSIPLIFAKVNNSYHGLLIDMIDPTEILIRRDNNIVVRSITTQGFKFHLFIGREPKDIMKDVMDFLGFKNNVKYWMLGVHICSENETVRGAYNELDAFLTRAAIEKLPFESHCGIAPVVFTDTTKSDVHEFLQSGGLLLKKFNKRFIPHLSPYITLHNNMLDESGVILQFKEFMLRDINSNIYKGSVNGFNAVYPDYENISNLFVERLWPYNVTLDGIIFENNWPLDESEKKHNESYLILPYFNKNFENAFDTTPQWNVLRPNGEKYVYKHNLYGDNFRKAFKNIVGDAPTFVTSQWINGEDVVNRQSVDTSWTSLRRVLIETALGGTSGRWLWSSPICGDAENFDPSAQSELCLKWYLTASFLPMVKIHSRTVRRDPLAFGETHKRRIADALKIRLSLLPYFYTSLQTGPILRPMFFQYPFVQSLEKLTSQFCIGNDILIVPNLEPAQSHVHVVMPPGSWYEFWSGMKIIGEQNDIITLPTTEADILTLIRAGAIIILQKRTNELAEETRLHSGFSLMIALECVKVNHTGYLYQTHFIKECQAEGVLYMTQNMSIKFYANQYSLYITSVGKDFQAFCDDDRAIWANTIEEINVYGLDENKNNYDYHKYIATSLNMCQLRHSDEIILTYV